MSATQTKQKRPAHWYRIYVSECPVCGRGDEVRERIYGRKPKDPNKRYVYETYACGSHFA